MEVEKIENLEELIRQYVGPNKSIVNTKVNPLTAPGENYMSTMVQVDVTLKNQENGKEEELHAVGKCLSGNVNDMIKNFLPFAFKNEIAFYNEIIPTLQDFQREQGVKEVLDVFPKLYTARCNVHGDNDDIDKNAILLIENLKVQGYNNIDRHIGFNLEEAKFIIKDLAAFHAVPLALKLLKPEVFENKIRKNCSVPDFGPPPTPEGNGPPPGPPELMWLDILEEYEECKLYLPQLKKKMESMSKNMEDFMNKPVREPFGTIVHMDMWINNTMQRYENGKLAKNKFVDFQMYRYSTPVEDLIFFIFSSLNLGVIKEHLDNLIKFYYDNFIRNLEDLGCDTIPFTYEKFLEEVRLEAPFQLGHVMFMTIVICGEKGVAAIDTSAPPGAALFTKETVSQLAKEKVIYAVNEFGKRGWIE